MLYVFSLLPNSVSNVCFPPPHVSFFLGVVFAAETRTSTFAPELNGGFFAPFFQPQTAGVALCLAQSILSLTPAAFPLTMELRKSELQR